ncbi:PAS domain S-box protein [Dankookia rubra]|uniref:histidine kinase n=1 Tax=Dankookia rubra TaxID=1442381 RepID=A0A4R5QDJ2_9PROT|nr:PAS domain-containing protein [Dankookia rubra]TDH61234.1 PAS domain S-box protein [Dankookia rubra]
MRALVSGHDWAATPLGPMGEWSRSLRAAVDLVLGSPLGMIVLWGPDLVQVYNDGYRAVMGAKHPGGLGQPTRGCWPEVWAFNAPIYAAVLGGRSRSFAEQLLVVERHGRPEEAWFDLTYSPLHDCPDAEHAEGRVSGVLVTVVEVTGRVRAEMLHRNSELRLAQMFEQAPTFMALLTGPEHRFERANPGYRRVVGDRDVVGHTVVEALPEVVDQGYLALLDGVYRTGVAHAADGARFVLDGEGGAPPREVFVDFVYQPLRDMEGQVTGIFVEGVDVTKRLRADASLRASEAQLRALNQDLERQVADRAHERSLTWQVSPHLLSVISLADGTFSRVNPAWHAVLGWSEAEIVGRPFTDFVHPDDMPALAPAWAQVRAHVPLLRFENRYRSKRGDYHWLRWSCVPDDGHLYSTAVDITADSAAAEALAATQDQLRQSQKLEAIGQLTGGVAHDFNNLLTVIRGSVELLRRAGLPEERRLRYVEAIGDAAGRATRLTGQLLAFARRQALTPLPFDVAASLREVAGMVRSLTGSRVRLDLNLPEAPFTILADRSQFDTAIVNMAINARDAMRGEGVLRIAAGPVSGIPAIRAHAPVAGDFVAVTMTDTGPGVPDADLVRIFEPFFTTKGVGEGTGLGLSQVIGFARQSGGDIRVESPPDGGATFTLYLPRAEPGTEEAEEEEATDAIPGGGVCVLVVEDNERVGEFATAALREIGYEGVLALDAAAALAELERDCERFHIVFSDVVMPGLSGIELGEEVRRRHPDIPIVLTSGYSHVLAQNGKHGFELLHKPYSIEQLSRVLRRAVAWQARRRNRRRDALEAP